MRIRLQGLSYLLIIAAAITGCATKPISHAGEQSTQHPPVTSIQNRSAAPESVNDGNGKTGSRRFEKPEVQKTPGVKNRLRPLNIDTTRQTGRLEESRLNEISGLAASARYPGLLYVINDSGNAPVLYAIDETGRLLAQWNINAGNRDWEDMTSLRLNGNQYLVIGDTGDNLRQRKTATLHLLAEPAFPASRTRLTPEHSITYRYDDGPRNIEALSAIGNTLYMISKEPITAAGPSAHRVYQLELPENLDLLTDSTVFTASFIGTMPSRAAGLEARLAAALAGVDLSHPTAMEFDPAGNVAYVLTYREVLRVRRGNTQSWAEAFSEPAERVMSHKLAQAEALTLSPGRAVWFTSERIGAPLWAIPLTPPL